MPTKKPSAAARTVDLFSGKTAVEEAVPEPIEADDRPDFEPMEERADGYRERAFKVQEWTTNVFGKHEGEGNQYRVTHKGDMFYLEELKRGPDNKSFYGYSGLMLHEKNFLNAARVIAQAAREYNK